MGYSARYHMASLAAVFLALAIGILIGVRVRRRDRFRHPREPREQPHGDLEDARDRADELTRELELPTRSASASYPTLVGDRLAGRSIGILALGEISERPRRRNRGGARADRRRAGRGGGDPRAAGSRASWPIDSRAPASPICEENLDACRRSAPAWAASSRSAGRCSTRAATSSPAPAAASADLDGVIVVRDQPTDLERRGARRRPTASRPA